MCRLGAVIVADGLQAAAPYIEAFQRAFSKANPHGSGIGGWADGAPRVFKSLSAASDNAAFSVDHWAPDTKALVFHARYATMGKSSLINNHPFVVGNRIFAHNGTFGHLDGVNQLLGDDLQRLGVKGDTDSERFGALLTKKTAEAGGDEVQGYKNTVEYLSENHPMTSLNSISIAPNGDMWVLRYPTNRTLFMKRLGLRDAANGQRLLTPPPGTAKPAEPGMTVFASRPLDAEAGWELIPSGRLVHIKAGTLEEKSYQIIDHDPRTMIVDNWIDLNGGANLGRVGLAPAAPMVDMKLSA